MTIVSIAPSLNSPHVQTVRLSQVGRRPTDTYQQIFEQEAVPPAGSSREVKATREGILPSLVRFFNWSMETNRPLFIAETCHKGNFEGVQFLVTRRDTLSTQTLAGILYPGLNERTGSSP